eukprot:6200578-Pleurochrysis_carterae.AAC.1
MLQAMLLATLFMETGSTERDKQKEGGENRNVSWCSTDRHRMKVQAWGHHWRGMAYQGSITTRHYGEANGMKAAEHRKALRREFEGDGRNRCKKDGTASKRTAAGRIASLRKEAEWEQGLDVGKENNRHTHWAGRTARNTSIRKGRGKQEMKLFIDTQQAHTRMEQMVKPIRGGVPQGASMWGHTRRRTGAERHKLAREHEPGREDLARMSQTRRTGRMTKLNQRLSAGKQERGNKISSRDKMNSKRELPRVRKPAPRVHKGGSKNKVENACSPMTGDWPCACTLACERNTVRERQWMCISKRDGRQKNMGTCQQAYVHKPTSGCKLKRERGSRCGQDVWRGCSHVHAHKLANMRRSTGSWERVCAREENGCNQTYGREPTRGHRSEPENKRACACQSECARKSVGGNKSEYVYTKEPVCNWTSTNKWERTWDARRRSGCEGKSTSGWNTKGESKQAGERMAGPGSSITNHNEVAGTKKADYRKTWRRRLGYDGHNRHAADKTASKQTAVCRIASKRKEAKGEQGSDACRESNKHSGNEPYWSGRTEQNKRTRKDRRKQEMEHLIDTQQAHTRMEQVAMQVGGRVSQGANMWGHTRRRAGIK